MKKKYLNLFLASALVVAFTDCSPSPNKRVENAQEEVNSADANLQEAQWNLQQAKADSVEYVNYTNQEDAKLLENELKIADLKLKMKKEGKEIQKKYQEELDDLERSNARMKSRIHEFNEHAKDRVDTFKLHFNQDMDKLGKSISAMAQRKIKK